MSLAALRFGFGSAGADADPKVQGLALHLTAAVGTTDVRIKVSEAGWTWVTASTTPLLALSAHPAPEAMASELLPARGER